MAWTYSDDPANVPRDAVRLELGDVNASDPMPLTDAAIAFYLTEESDDVLRAAARAAEALAGYYGRQTDYSMGNLSQSASQRAASFRTLAATLRRKGLLSGSGAQVFAGGLVVADKATLAADSSATQPAFAIGQDDFPGTTSSTDTED